MIRCLKSAPKNPTDDEVERVDHLFFTYDRTQIRAGDQLEMEHPEVSKRTKLEEIWAWEDYAIRQFSAWVKESFEASEPRGYVD